MQNIGRNIVFLKKSKFFRRKNCPKTGASKYCWFMEKIIIWRKEIVGIYEFSVT
jgi:hypothetical protein